MRAQTRMRGTGSFAAMMTGVVLATCVSGCVSLPPDRYGHPRSIDLIHAPLKKTVGVLAAGAVWVGAEAANPHRAIITQRRQDSSGTWHWYKNVPGVGTLQCQGASVAGVSQQCERSP